MRSHRAVAGVLALLAGISLGASPSPRIVAEWSSPKDAGTTFHNILALGITDQREVRHRFEDKVVSHLRGRNIPAVTSYSVVPDLLAPGSREEILRRIETLKIDGVLTFRVVPLHGHDEAAWDGEWKSRSEGPGTLRELVEATVPIKKVKSRKYGVEVTFWAVGEPGRLWAGRSGPHSRQELLKGAGDFIQDVIQTLRYAHRI